MLKIAIIGSGVMGGIHGKIAQESGKADVLYVVDQDIERAESLAVKLEAKPIGQVKELSDKEIDLAFICVPNNYHAAVSIEVLELGINVFCEKPLATSYTDAKRMVETAQRCKKRLFVGHNRRFAPVYEAAKREVSAAQFKPQNINMIQNDGDMGGEGSLWAANFETIGGFLYDTTVHFLDMAEYLMGPIASVSAVSKQACYPVQDDFVIQMQFESGGIGVISSCGHASWIYPFERIQVVGDHQSVITEELDSFRYAPGLSKTIKGEDYSKLPFEQKWGYVDMHHHMYQALYEETAARNDATVGLRAVALVSACQKSAESNGMQHSIEC